MVARPQPHGSSHTRRRRPRSSNARTVCDWPRSLLRLTLEREPPRQRSTFALHRIRRWTKEHPVLALEPEESLLLRADVIRPPCGVDLERDAAFLVVDRACPGVGDVRAQQHRAHLLAHRHAG